MGGLGKLTGKDKKNELRNQYNNSLAESYLEEDRALERIIVEKVNEHSKIGAHRQSLISSKQQETQSFLQEKTSLLNAQAKREETFKAACQKIKDNMQLIRAGLHACMSGDIEMVELLLKKEYGLRLVFFNLYPLHIAAENNQTNIIKLLCEYGVNLNRTNAEGYVALELAEWQGHGEAVETLNQIAKESQMLWNAVEQGDTLTMKAALERGADINITNSEGYNTLQLAIVRHKNYETITFLIKAGADYFHQNNELNKSAIVLAEEHPDTRIKVFISLVCGVEENGNAWLMAPQNKQLLGQLPGYEKVLEGLQVKEEIQAIVSKFPLISQEHSYIQRGFYTAMSLKEQKYNKVYRAYYQERYRTGGSPYDAIGMQKFADKEYGYERAAWEDQNNTKLLNLYQYYINHGYAYQAEGVKQYLAEFVFKQVATNEISDKWVFPERFSLQSLFGKEDISLFSKTDLILQEYSPIQSGYNTAKSLKEGGWDKTYRANYQERYRTGDYPYDARGMQRFEDEEYGYEVALGREQTETTLVNLYHYYLKHDYPYQAEGVKKYLIEFTPKTKDKKIRIENEKIKAFLNKILTYSYNLLEAAENGDWTRVKQSLSQGAYINAVDSKGYNALQKAIVAKKVSLELLNGLIKAGIDLNYQIPNGQSTLTLVKAHLPQMARLFIDEPVMGIRKFLTTPKSLEEIKLSFQEHCDRAQRFLDKYSDDAQKVQAMMTYYYWLTKVEPYALYVFPIMVMLSQLTAVLKKAEESLPDELLKSFPKQQILEAAFAFFKRTRAMHCVLNEIGTDDLSTEPEFIGFGYISSSIQLKREAAIISERLGVSLQDPRVLEEIYKTQKSLLLAGTASVLSAFATQVYGMDKIKLAEVEASALELLEYQQQHQATLKAQFKQFIHESTTETIHEMAENGLIQLPPKLSLKKGLQAWEIGHQEVQTRIQHGEEELEREKAALHEWLNQRETEYVSIIKKLDEHIQSTYQADGAVNAEFQRAYTEIRQSFAQYRIELEHNYHEARRKITRAVTKQWVSLAAAALLAPMLAPTLTAALGTVIGITGSASTLAALNIIVEGALMGGMSAAFSGNTGGILKGAFISGWMAGFGHAMGGLLEKSSTIQNLNKLFPKGATTVTKVGEVVIERGVVTKTVVAGMTTAIHVGLEGGKLSDGLLTSIGTTLAVGGSKKIDFISKLNEQFATVLVSATITSLVTRSSFLENAAMIGATTLIQSTASSLGNHIAEMSSQEQARRNLERKKKVFTELQQVAEKVGGPIRPYQQMSSEDRMARARLEAQQLKTVKHQPNRSAGREEAFRELTQRAKTIEKRDVTSRTSNTNKAVLEKAFDDVTLQASRVLADNQVAISDERIKQAFKKHPALQGSRQDIQKNLVKLGKEDGPVKDPQSAFMRGVEKVFLAVLNTLVGEAHASEMGSSYNLSQQDNDSGTSSQPSFGSMAWRALTGDKSPEVVAWQKRNRESMPILAQGSDALNKVQEQLQPGTRSLGALQALGGAGQIMLSPSTGLFAPVLGAIGTDNVVTGLQVLWSGKHQSTSLFHVVNGVGKNTGLYGPQSASYIEFGLNIVPTVNPRTLTFAYRFATKGSKPVPREIFPEVDLVNETLQRTSMPVSKTGQPSVVVSSNDAIPKPKLFTPSYNASNLNSSVPVLSNNTTSISLSKETEILIGKANNCKEQLFERPGKMKVQTTLHAAKIELQGGQIDLAIERGILLDHVTKVKNAQKGLLRHLHKINSRLSHPELPMIEREILNKELSKTSRLLDFSERFVPRNSKSVPELTKNISCDVDPSKIKPVR